MKILNLILLVFISNYSCNSSQVLIKDQEDKSDTSQQINKIGEDLTYIQAMNNFEQSKPLIQDYLSELKQAELHFFWTTGYTISDNPEYQPDRKVNVGGLGYANKFFPYVEKLLHNSPNILNVKFVCDTLTLESNQWQINHLKQVYGTRFEILPIEMVHNNLLSAFSSSEQQKKIDVIFKNATQGTPVIASDIYRLIGMVYGRQNLPEDINQKQYTYCDVDTFCYGMEGKRSEELIKALFKNIVKSSFYFGKGYNINDLIKLSVNNLIDYKNFCDEILKDVDIKPTVIEYYTILHAKIKLYEKSSQHNLSITSLLPDFVTNGIKTILQSTGPRFVGLLKNTSEDLIYPYVCAAEWNPKEIILDCDLGTYSSGDPDRILEWKNILSIEEDNALKLFRHNCNDYRRFISAAMYSKRFGENHPFNLILKKYLIEHYPYHSPSFRNLLQINFEGYHKESKQYYKLSCDSPSKYRNNTVYLKKDNDKLIYKFKSSNNDIVTGQIDIHIKYDLDWGSLDEHTDKILEKLLEQGHELEPKKGLSKQEWKSNTYKYLIKHSEEPASIGAHHYVRLTYLLKELNINICLTEALLEINQ